MSNICTELNQAGIKCARLCASDEMKEDEANGWFNYKLYSL
jgi:hypothetical protein